MSDPRCFATGRSDTDDGHPLVLEQASHRLAELRVVVNDEAAQRHVGPRMARAASLHIHASCKTPLRLARRSGPPLAYAAFPGWLWRQRPGALACCPTEVMQMGHCESPKILRGRRSEQQALERLVADTRTGMGGALVLRGEAGIGKTSLLDYLETCGTGCRILRVAGVESETELDFAVLHRLCGTVLDLVGPAAGPAARCAQRCVRLSGPRESRPLPRRSSRPCHPQGGLGRAAASLHRRRGRRCRSRLDRNARVRRAPAVGRPDRNRLCRPQREVKRAGGATGAGDPGRSRRRRASARRVDRRRST